NRHVRAALPLQFELRLLQALPDLIVGNRDGALHARLPGPDALELGDLRIAIDLESCRRGGVVAVAVDDHARRIISRRRPVILQSIARDWSPPSSGPQRR